MAKTDKTSTSLANQEWSALSFRLTAFLIPSYVTDLSVSWWKDVVGELPENQKANPRLLQKVETGAFNNTTLALEIQPGRVDWRITGLSPTEPIPSSPIDLLPIPKLLPDFLTIANQWIKISPPIIRLAFGAQLGIPVDDRVTGYKILTKHLPKFDIDSENSSDFLYQINRPRISSVLPSMKINRLSKWLVAIFTTSNMNLLLENPALSTTTQQFLTCTLEMDINTDAGNTKEFSVDQSIAQLLELTNMAQEIAGNGDIP